MRWTPCPKSYRDAGLAMGATQWQTIWRVVVPAARSGILTAVMLGMGRAIGETMAVMMVTGNAARMPPSLDSLFRPVRTMTATIAAEMGEVAQGSTHYHALFGIGIILFVLTFLINLAAASAIFQKRRREGCADGCDCWPKPVSADTKRRYLIQRAGFALLALATLVVVVPILLVVGIIVARGIAAINWEFLFGDAARRHEGGRHLPRHRRARSC